MDEIEIDQLCSEIEQWVREEQIRMMKEDMLAE